MTLFRAFDDERLDANLAAILGLPDAVDPASATSDPAAAASERGLHRVPTLHRVRGARRASVNVVVALGIALCGAVVALLAGRTDMSSGDPESRSADDGRHVIQLSGTTIIRRPSDSATPSPAAIATTAARRDAVRRKGTPTAHVATVPTPVTTPEAPPPSSPPSLSQPPSPSPSPSSLVGVVPAPATPAVTTVTTADARRITGARGDGPTPAPVPAPMPAPMPAREDAAAVEQNRRDSIDAIRSLRRQW